MNEILIKATNLTKKYGQLTAVDNLDFHVQRGEIFGLLGPNGAGKSTCIECILGTRNRDSGTVTILGMDPVTEGRKVFEKVGVQFQASYYPDRIKVSEMCELIASLYSKNIKWQQMLEDFALDSKINQMVSDLSGGERQKLSVILALLHEPEIVFLDELTTGLDPIARREVWHLLKSLQEKGLTIFLTSHYMDEVNHLCDRISIISHGKVVVTGSPQEVIKLSGKGNLEEAYLFHLGKKEAINDEVTMGIV